MEWLAILGLSLVAAWAVNLAADVLPGGKPYGPALAQHWRAPVRLLWAPAHNDGQGHRLRTRLVWVASPVLGALALAPEGIGPGTLLVALYAWFFLAVAVIDLEHRRVLNVMMLAVAPFAVAASLVFPTPGWQSALAGGLLGFGFFLIVALIRPGGMGMGDVKLAGAIGLVTGLGGVMVALAIGILAGGVAAVYLLLRSRFAGARRFDRGLTMAYAPYLVLGTWVALFW